MVLVEHANKKKIIICFYLFLFLIRQLFILSYFIFSTIYIIKLNESFDIISISLLSVHNALKSSHSFPIFTLINSFGSRTKCWGVFGLTEMSNFLTTSAMAAFDCINANFWPRQTRGPSPKGNKTPLSMKALTPPCSELNRSGINFSGSG